MAHTLSKSYCGKSSKTLFLEVAQIGTYYDQWVNKPLFFEFSQDGTCDVMRYKIYDEYAL